MTQCPVCKKNGLSEGVHFCPQCNADLECFQLLDKLHDPVNVQNNIEESDKAIDESIVDDIVDEQGEVCVTQKNSNNRLLAVLLFIVCILLVVQTFYFINQFAQSEQQLKNELSRFSEQLQKNIQSDILTAKTEIQPDEKARIVTNADEKVLQDIDNKVTALEQTFSDLLSDIKNDISLLPSIELLTAIQSNQGDNNIEQTPENFPEAFPEKTPEKQLTKPIIFYQSNKDDTLWSIARVFYGKGSYYPVILKMNPGLNLNNHQKYGKIKLFKHTADMMELYQQIKMNSNE